jgi:hypothetical protein
MSPTSGDLEGLRSDEFGVEIRIAIFEKHGDNLFEVLSEFVDCYALRMRTRPPGDVADINAGLSIFLDDRGKVPHGDQASIVMQRRLTRP